MKPFTEPIDSKSFIFSNDMKGNLQSQLSDLQIQMHKKRLEKKYDEVEFLEREIDSLHRKILRFTG